MLDIVSTLVRQQILDDEAAQTAREQLAAGVPIDDALHAAVHGPDGTRNGEGSAAEEKVLRFFADQFGLKYAELDKAEPSRELLGKVGSSRVDLQACKLEYSIVSPK